MYHAQLDREELSSILMHFIYAGDRVGQGEILERIPVRIKGHWETFQFLTHFYFTFFSVLV